MESLTECSVLKFRPDTLHSVRKMYGLDKPGRIDEAVDILDKWIKKQNHFVCKEFDRSYLERFLINSKGSIEVAKSRLDKLCTGRTIMSEYFQECEEVRNMDNIAEYSPMPNLTPEGHRVYICRIRENSVMTDKSFAELITDCIFDCEYIMKNDYNSGIVGMYDLRTLNLMDAITKIDISLLQTCSVLVRDGYGFRIKGLHFISGSKFLEKFIQLLKTVFPAKIANRIHVHNTHETIYDYVPKELLSEDYGGNAPPLSKLNEIKNQALKSEKFLQHMKKMNQCRTDESKRIGGKPDLDFLDGTFRNLTVD